jgi:hypothetical protein
MRIVPAIVCLCVAAIFLRWYARPASATPRQQFILRWFHGVTWIALAVAAIARQPMFALAALAFYAVFLATLLRTKAR